MAGEMAQGTSSCHTSLWPEFRLWNLTGRWKAILHGTYAHAHPLKSPASETEAPGHWLLRGCVPSGSLCKLRLKLQDHDELSCGMSTKGARNAKHLGLFLQKGHTHITY